MKDRKSDLEPNELKTQSAPAALKVAASGSERAAPSLRLVLRVWLTLSVQSFGGGVATLALIRQAVVERRGWLSEAEFTRYWVLVQAAPGINLLALTILIGRRLGGWRGIGVCLLGLLLPSVAITILLTAGYARIQNAPVTRAVLRGVVPATVGVGLVTAIQMARVPLAASRREGSGALLAALFILTASGFAAYRLRMPVILILCAAGGVGAITHWLRARRDPTIPSLIPDAGDGEPRSRREGDNPQAPSPQAPQVPSQGSLADPAREEADL